MPRLGIEPGPLDAGSSALTTRKPYLLQLGSKRRVLTVEWFQQCQKYEVFFYFALVPHEIWWKNVCYTQKSSKTLGVVTPIYGLYKDVPPTWFLATLRL